MAIYIRTEAGTAAVTNPRVFLPHRLRALLAAIDGRVDPREYGGGAWTPSEVQTMLDSLIRVGYVRIVDKVEPPAAAAAPAPRMAAAAPAAAPVQVVPGDELRQAVALMTDFATRHLPQEAMELLFALDMARTPAELRAQLGTYSERVARLGPTGRRHLNDVQALLSGAAVT